VEHFTAKKLQGTEKLRGWKRIHNYVQNQLVDSCQHRGRCLFSEGEYVTPPSSMLFK